jgi:hypothetical protein
VARVVAFIPDLLFGSNVVGVLRGAGHEPVLISDPATLPQELIGADLLVVDLTADPAERIERVGRNRRPEVPILAFYSHVESEVRAQA